MRQTRLSYPAQGGYQRYFCILCKLSSLCVALRSHIRPLTHTPSSPTKPHITQDAVYLALGRGIVEARERLRDMTTQERNALTGSIGSSSTGRVTHATKSRLSSQLSSSASRPTHASKMRSVSSRIKADVRYCYYGFIIEFKWSS